MFLEAVLSDILRRNPIGTVNRYQLGLSVGGPTAEQLEVLCAEAEKGYSISGCAAKADLTHDCVKQWLSRGRKARQRYEDGEDIDGYELRIAEFTELFERARAKGVRQTEDEQHDLAQAGNGAWTAKAWRLERGHRAEFGKQDPDGTAGGVTIVLQASLDRGQGWGEIVDAEVGVVEELPAAPRAIGVPQEPGPG